MQTEASLERDTDLIEDYIEVLNAKAARPWPFGKLAALGRLGLLRRRLATAVRRSTDPELERAEAAAVAETSSTWMRRVATSFWGTRALVALVVVGGWQLLLLAILIFSAAYVNLAARPPKPESGYVPALTRNAILFLVLFVFVFYVGLPLLALLVMWGGRFFRAWRTAAPAALLVVLAAAGATWATFRGLDNPAAAPDSIHEFVETRSTSTSSDATAYGAYQAWLDMNWLLKDPKLKADYEQYLRNGPGRWLTNRFDTTNAAAWADPQTLVHIGELVDQQHDQAKFREWLKDYVERNKIYSRDIDTAIDTLLGPGQQRFLSVWQAEPFLEDRDVNRRRHYFASIFSKMRSAGIVYFGALIVVALIVFAIGPAVLTAGWVARVARLERVARTTERFRTRYYAVPEQRDLASASVFEGTVDLLVRVQRAWVRLVLVVAILVFGATAVWLATRSATTRPVATQNALMHRFVAIPSARPAAAAAGLEPVAASPVPASGGASPVEAGFAGGTGDPSTATDVDGDGRPDERAVPPVEARLAAIQQQLDDADYEFRKKFKTTAALLEAYRREIESLRTENGQLERRFTDLASTTGALGSRIGSAEAQARSAAAAATAAESRAESVGGQVSALADSVDERTGTLARRAEALEKRDDELQTTVDAVATDLDETSSELTARTERLGDRATDLAERTEQVAQLQRTVYAALVDEFTRQIAAIERRSHSRIYRMFNKKEARAQLADLRRRIQLVRAQLQATDDPDAPRIDRKLVELQSSIGPVEERYK